MLNLSYELNLGRVTVCNLWVGNTGSILLQQNTRTRNVATKSHHITSNSLCRPLNKLIQMVITGLRSPIFKLRCTIGQEWHYKYRWAVAFAFWLFLTWMPRLTMTDDTLSDIIFGFKTCLGQWDYNWTADVTCP